MYLIGIAAIGVFTFVYFALLNTAIPVVIFVAIILSFRAAIAQPRREALGD
jgi:hypothetical protein